MNIREVMTAPVTTIRDVDKLSLAHQIMLWNDVRHLPVVRGTQLVGMITDRDVLAQRQGWKLPDVTIGEVMTSDPRTIEPDADLSDAARMFVSEHFDGLPVVEDGNLVGIITSTDLMRSIETRGEPAATEHAVREIMTPDPAHCDEEEPLFDAIGRMLELGIRHLPVVDPEGRVVGMLSDRDVRNYVGDPRSALSSARAGLEFDELTVRDVMTSNPTTVSADTGLDDAIAWFTEGFGALPVVDDDDRLVGILSYLDVLWRVRG